MASVHDHCVEKKMTLEELSQRSGLDVGRLQAIYLGRWTPSPSERQKVATALDVEVSDIAWGHRTPIQHIYGHGPD